MKITKMGVVNTLALIILVTLSLFSDTKVSDESQAQQLISQKGSGTAIIMTGAAARIPQQAALLEELYNRGLLKDVVFISGVSAGALNAVILNAILSGKLTWDDYRKILFSLRNSDIFTVSQERKLPVNTEPVRKLFEQIVEERLGYHQIGDLPYMTEISFTSRGDLGSGRRVYRMCSRKINRETDTTLSLVDIMMATSAIPFAFPPVRIENVTTIPDHEYIDGGVGSDYIPFKALLDFQKHRGENVEKVYIISRKSGNYSEIGQELDFLGVDNKGRMDRFASSLDKIMRRILINRLGAFARQAPEMIYHSYVWIPDFEQDFMMFNFNNLEEQYTLTRAWAQNNDPVPLGDFLLYNRLKRRK
jgi:hypothetical protein